MSRVFLMKWYHFTVEHFEDLRNINHCEFLIMRKIEETGKYLLENKLRTWSELRRERLEQLESGTQANKDAAKLTRTKTFVSLRRWGGCPHGCDHRREYKRREDLETLRLRDEAGANGANGTNGTNGHSNGTNGNTSGNSSSTLMTISTRRHITKQQRSVQIQDSTTTVASGPQIDITKALEELDSSSPDATPSFISAEDRLRSLRSPHLHIGRDGGGTYSGHASLSGSDDELSADEEGRRPGSSGLGSLAARIHSTSHSSKVRIRHVDAEADDDEADRKKRVYLDESGMGRGAMANRLGDHSHSSSDVGSDVGSPDTRPGDALASPLNEDELTRLEKEEKSVQGSVY